MPHKILVLGGSGATGRSLTSQALEQGHAVTVIARHPDAAGISHAALTLVAGDVSGDSGIIARVLPGHDVVISVLGRGLSFKSEQLLARSTPHLVSAMQSCAVRRLVFMSAIGVDGPVPSASLIARLFWRYPLAEIYADKAIAEKIVLNSGLDWTIVAPVRLTNGKRTGTFVLVEGSVERGPWAMTRADAAAATLRCVDDSTTIRKRLVTQ